MKRLSGPSIHLFLGAAIAGGVHGGLQGWVVLAGERDWIQQPVLLVAGAIGLGAGFAGTLGVLLGGWMGRCLLAGFFGGALGIGLAEGVLAVLTGPPAFLPSAWWVDHPGVLLGGGVAALLAIWGVRWRMWTGWGWSLLCVILLPLLGWRSSGSGPISAGEGPNLLLVTLDTARGDHVGSVGYPRDTMPRLDALSGQGIRFDAAISQIPVTGPSHMTLFSGLGPWRHGALLNGVPVPDDAPLLATALQEAGYRTGAFVSAFVLDEQVGLGRGFQVYDDDFAWPHGGSDLLPVRFGAALRRRFLPDLVVERTGADTTDLALSWLGAGAGPWFLWVHLFDPHAPYEPSETFQRFADSPAGDPMVDAYDGELAATDHALSRLLDAITDRGEEQNTLVVVAGDHGESLGEHDVWYDHGGDLFSPVARVPLAFRWPGVLPEGVVVSELVELTDLSPTVRSLLDLPAAEGDGMDLALVWSGGEGRGFSRSICLDRTANREERAENPKARPHWRQAAIRREDSLVVARESGAEQEFWTLAPNGSGGFLESPMQSWSETVLADVPRALALVAGDAGEAPVLDAETRSRLEALGYVEGDP